MAQMQTVQWSLSSSSKRHRRENLGKSDELSRLERGAVAVACPKVATYVLLVPLAAKALDVFAVLCTCRGGNE